MPGRGLLNLRQSVTINTYMILKHFELMHLFENFPSIFLCCWTASEIIHFQPCPRVSFREPGGQSEKPGNMV